MHTGNKSAESSRLQIRAIRISMAVGVAMVVLKFGAFGLTGSTAILSDALETVVHVLAVGFALFSIHFSLKPPDREHPYGHAKIHFFSAGFEGAMIVVAAFFIYYEAISRWIAGIQLENLGLGLGLTFLTVVINGGLGYYLIRTGKKENSLTLVANGKHVLTDCWTSVGVLVGLALAHFTGLLFWDPLMALIVASNILVTGYSLLRQSFAGLLDRADPKVEKRLTSLLNEAKNEYAMEWHNLRHRNLGDGHWVDLHLQFDDDMSLREAHRRATAIENLIREDFSSLAKVTTHLEPLREHDEIHRH